MFSATKISFAPAVINDTDSKVIFFKPLVEKAVRAGIDSNFIREFIRNPAVEFSDRYVKVNVGGYLKKADYSSNYNTYSVNKCMRFLRRHYDQLLRAESQFCVPMEVISSILWVETKHGNYLGSNYITSVFASAAMADEWEFIDMNKSEAHKNFRGDMQALHALDSTIEARSHKKAQWALGEILSLEKISKSGKLDIYSLKGSWAGAFGLPQFLPTSYLTVGVDGNEDAVVDLFNTDDAIFSVANYLHTQGWSDNLEDQRKAVFHYNNSSDYVYAVLTLADKIKQNRSIIIEDTDSDDESE
jgi:membrane-bound lytic murein transglycosylase B